MPFTLALTDEQADVILRALSNLSDDALSDRTKALISLAQADAIVNAIDNYNDPSDAYMQARLLAFKAGEGYERTAVQRKNLGDDCQELMGLIADAMVESRERVVVDDLDEMEYPGKFRSGQVMI